MTYNILAINPGHNGSAALVVDGNLVYYAEEERLSRMKYDGNPFRAMLECLQSVKIDELVIGGTSPEFSKLPWTGEDAYTALVRKYNPNVKVTNMGHMHHLGHAAAAFYGSGFTTAAALIVDGAGSYHTVENKVGGFETESIFKCSYPSNIVPLYKRYSDGQSPYYNDGEREFDNSVTITKAYEAVSDYLGFGYIEAGKTMGLAPYGQYDQNIPPFFVQNKGNKNLLIPRYPAGSNIDEDRFPYLKRSTDPKAWHKNPALVRDVDKNLAFHIQKEAEQQMIRLIKKAVELTGEKNIVIAGGFGLNCVANYRYLEEFPDLNIYVDPVSHDGGTAIGLAKLAWYVHSNSNEVSKLDSLYLGTASSYNNLPQLLQSVDTLVLEDADAKSVANLIATGNIVSMFNGKAEAGPRALGNRSILYDPRDPKGKDFVNRVKGREWFRPFAGSVLEEHAHDWFEMRTLKSSPFMMYAVNVQADKVEKIPCVTHVDNTCRVQTVNKQDNEHYYNLISEFYKQTGVPVVFNTSFNLAGDPLVDNLIDALNTILNSDINYLYLPEIGKIIKKK